MSNGNNQKSYDSYMLGGSYGCGVSPSWNGNGSSTNQRRGSTSSVRDAMQWGGCCKSSLGKSRSTYAMGNSMSNCYNQPKAFFNFSGKGGQGEHLPVPCSIAPLGTNPSSMIKPMEPITVRVQAPLSSRPSNGGPMTFTLDPSQIYGNMFK